MSKDWKTDRTEVAIKEGTDKIMKAAQEKDKKDDFIVPEWHKEIVRKRIEKSKAEPKLEVCVGVGLNQLFPEYITIDLSGNE
jgi:hypothetical protein